MGSKAHLGRLLRFSLKNRNAGFAALDAPSRYYEKGSGYVGDPGGRRRLPRNRVFCPVHACVCRAD